MAEARTGRRGSTGAASIATPGPVEVGARVLVATSTGAKKGQVRFIGPTKFKEGEWVGVELDEPEGKHDGMVDGVRYFTCETPHGMFVKPTTISLDPAAGVISAPPSRRSSLVQESSEGKVSNTLLLAKGRRQSMLAMLNAQQPQPQPEADKPLPDVSKPASEASQPSTPAVRRQARAGPPSIDSEVGFAVGREGAGVPGSPAASVSSRTSKASFVDIATPPGSRVKRDPPGSGGRGRSSPAPGARGGGRGGATRPSTSRTASPAAGGTSHVPKPRTRRISDGERSDDVSVESSESTAPAASRVQELELRVRELEGKLAAAAAQRRASLTARDPKPQPDADATGELGEASQAGPGIAEVEAQLEQLRAAVAESEAAREEEAQAKAQLQEKADALQAELVQLRKREDTILAKEMQTTAAVAQGRASVLAVERRVADREQQLADMTDALEAVTLDKEGLALEKEELTDRLEEATLELEALKLELEHAQLTAQENAAAAEALKSAGVSGVGSSGGVDLSVVVEQNAQLKEALKRLHDMATHERQELGKQVRTLDKEASQVAPLKEEVAKLRAWKEDKAQQLEELMERVDQGQVYEDMVEGLTEKNLALGDKVTELEGLLSDLEASLELSEEMEAQQAEEIRVLQRQSDSQEALLVDRGQQLKALAKDMADAKNTIERFRTFTEQLKEEREQLAGQLSQGTGQLEHIRGQTRAILAQHQSLAKQAAAARSQEISRDLLSLELTRANALAQRLELLLPPQLCGGEDVVLRTELAAGVVLAKADLLSTLLRKKFMGFLEKAANVKGASPASGPPEEGLDAPEERAADPLEAMELVDSIPQVLHESRTAALVTELANQARLCIGRLSSRGLEEDEGHPKHLAAAALRGQLEAAEAVLAGLLSVYSLEGGLPPHLTPDCHASLAEAAQALQAEVTVTDLPSEEAYHAAGDLEAAIAAVLGALVQTTAEQLGGESAEELGRSVPALRETWASLSKLQRDLAAAGEGDVQGPSQGSGAAGSTDLLAGLAEVRRQAQALLDVAKGAPPPESAELGGVLLESAQALLGTVRGITGETTPGTAAPPLLTTTMAWAALTGRGGRDANASCVLRAKRVRERVEDLAKLRPMLEAVKVQLAQQEDHASALSKELLTLNARRAELEDLVERSNAQQKEADRTSQQVAALDLECAKLRADNGMLQEAMEALQEEADKYMADNRQLRAQNVPGSGMASPSSRAARESLGAKQATLLNSLLTGGGGRGPTALGGLSRANSGFVGGYASPPARSAQDPDTAAQLEALMASAQHLHTDALRWRAMAFQSMLRSMPPLPDPRRPPATEGHVAPNTQDADASVGPGTGVGGAAAVGVGSSVRAIGGDAGAELAQVMGALSTLSRKIQQARSVPRVVNLVATKQSSASGAGGATGSSAREAWRGQQLEASRLLADFRALQDRSGVLAAMATEKGVKQFRDAGPTPDMAVDWAATGGQIKSGPQKPFGTLKFNLHKEQQATGDKTGLGAAAAETPAKAVAVVLDQAGLLRLNNLLCVAV